MPAFVLIVSPFVLFGLGAILTLFYNQTIGRIPTRIIKVILAPILPFIIAFHFLDYRGILKNHTILDPYIERWIAIEEYEQSFFVEISTEYPENTIIFNTTFSEYGHVPAMFFTPYTAYNFLPTPHQVQMAKETGRPIIMIDKGDLGSDFKEDPDIQIVKADKWIELMSTLD